MILTLDPTKLENGIYHEQVQILWGDTGLLLAEADVTLRILVKPESDFARKALVIGLDGAHPVAVGNAHTPFIDMLTQFSLYSFEAKTQLTTPTNSGPGWLSILTGVTPEKHLVIDNQLIPERDRNYPSFLKRAKDEFGLTTAAAAVWYPLITQLLKDEEALDHTIQGFDFTVAPDFGACLKDNNPDISFVQFDDIDHAGHAHGFSPDVPEYIDLIETTDAYVGVLLDSILLRETIKNEHWLIMITTDHAGNMEGHGQMIDEVQTIFVIASGVPKSNGPVTDRILSHLDVYPTVMKFMGIDINPDWELDGQAIGY